MSNLIVKPVESRRERKQFLNLPWQIYRGNSNWIPPLRLNQKELVGYVHHPFYDDAEGQTFLALRDGKPCGRILAVVHHAHFRKFKEQRGYFGFFETVDDPEVATGLFDAARAWLAERDIVKVRGPLNPSINYEIGLLIDGFDTPPTFMMTYNPPYYQRLIEDYGFQKTQDLVAFDGHVDMLATLDKKLTFIVEEATRRFNVHLRPISKRRFRQEVQMFLDLYNQSMAGHWGFVPLSQGEVDHMAASLQYLIVPEMTTVAEVDGKPVGGTFGLLDYNPLIKKSDGRLFPFGFLRLLWNRRKIKRIRLLATMVTPEFQRWGLGLLILSRVLPDALKWGIETCEFSWVAESNHLSYSTLKRGGAKITKTYRLYDLDPP